MGHAYLAVGRVSEAVEMLESASLRHDSFRIRYPTESVIVRYFLGQAYEASGWNDKAIQKYEEFLHIWRNADEDILLLKEARNRLAKLKAFPHFHQDG